MAWKLYRRKLFVEMRPYVTGEQLPESVTISPAAQRLGSPRVGDMIARDPQYPKEEWLVPERYVADNFERVVQ